MSETRPTEYVTSIDVSASLPVGDEGNATIPNLGGAGLAVFECTAVNGLTAKVEVLTKAGGTWRTRKSYQQAANGTPAAVAANTAITLVAGDLIYVDVRGFHAVRLKRAAGTSATLTARVGESAASILLEQVSSASQVQGTLAHDAVSTNNPLRIGGKAETALSTLTVVSDGDVTDLFATVDGRQITVPYCNPEDAVSGNASNTDGTSTQVIAAQSGSIKTALTTIILTNAHATTFAYVEIKDGTTVKLTIPVPPSSGAIVTLPVPLVGSAATAWNFDPSAAVTTLYCSMVGYKTLV